MASLNVVIWGAGRIGRGFAGDLFDAAGYHITFVDQSQTLIDALRARGQYAVVCAESAEQRRDRVISGFEAISTRETDAIVQAILRADLLAVCVFPKDFSAVAHALLPALIQRQQARPPDALNIILFTNLAHAGPQLRACLAQAARSETIWNSLDEYIGIVETLVIRMVADPPEAELARDPLLVWTNGYAELPADRDGFKGIIPSIPGLRLVDDMRAEETRKLYTYNTFHAALAYFGALYDLETVVDCLSDPRVRVPAEAVLAESTAALQAEYGFSVDEMSRWNAGVRTQTNNPALRDTVARFAADPARKLARTDRLIGPLLLSRRHELPFQQLASAAAAAVYRLVRESNAAQRARSESELVWSENSNSLAVHMSISDLFPDWIRRVCGLDEEPEDDLDDVLRAIVAAFRQLEWGALARRAGQLAFEYEKTYRGCGQCVFAGITETLGNFNATVFEAATALAGGLGLAGDSTCGALIGATLALSLVTPRHRDRFDGDRTNKYRAYDLAQQLRQKYLDNYGSTRCHDIHRAIMGRPFDLCNAAERQAFEEAGAHADKCTGVVGRAAQWAVEILGEKEKQEGTA